MCPPWGIDLTTHRTRSGRSTAVLHCNSVQYTPVYRWAKPQIKVVCFIIDKQTRNAEIDSVWLVRHSGI